MYHFVTVQSFLLALSASFITISNCWETCLISTIKQTIEKNPNILVFDKNIYHSEIRFAVIQALMLLPFGHIQITIWQRQYNEHLILQEIVETAAHSFHSNISNWKYHKTLNNFVEDPNQEWYPILTTCRNGATPLHTSFKTKVQNYKTLCFSHRSNMNGPISKHTLQARIQRFNYTFLTLSQHVTSGLQQYLTQNNQTKTETHTFVPVFKYSRLETFGKNWQTSTIVVQGRISLTLRDYGSLFDSLKKRQHLLANLKIQLIGSNTNNLEVPPELTNNIEIHSKLTYPEFYDLISRAIAIFPAFPTKNLYVKDRASSTVPVSIITCVPIVADDAILKAYSYLNTSVVWYRNSKETEVETLLRYTSHDNFPQVFEDKRQMLKELRESLIKQNADLLKTIMF